MCRPRWHTKGHNPWCWPHFLDSRLLLRGGRTSATLLLLLAILAGCTSSGTSRRIGALKSVRPTWSLSKSTGSDLAEESIESGKSAQTVATTVSNIRLLANKETPTGETSADRDASSSDTVQADGSSKADSFEVRTAGITLAELEAIALANNPTLVQAQAAVNAEQGIYVQAGLYPNPQLGYLNGSASSPGVKESNGLFYSQEFPTANKLSLAQNSAAVEIQRYQWDTESQRKRVLNDLKIRYYEVLGSQESLAVMEKILQTAESINKKAEEVLSAGWIDRSEYLQARRHLDLARLSRDEAKDRYLAAWEQLATMVGCSPMQPVPIIDQLGGEIPSLDLESSWQNLLANSPQLRSSECDLGHAWATYREAQSQAVPNVTLQIVSEYDRVIQATQIGTLVALPVPIFNRNQGNIDKSAADIQAADAEIRRVKLVLRDQLSESFRKYQSGVKKVEVFKTSIVPGAEENLQVCLRRYNNRETGFVPVLTAQDELSKSQSDYVETLTELRKVIVEIEGMELLGGLNPAAIGSAIQNAPGGGSQRQRAILNEAQDRNSKQLLNSAQFAK